MKLLGPVYPILFAVYFPLALYARNASEVALPDLTLPIACIIALTISIQIGLRVLSCNVSKYHIVISACWLVFFFYSPVYDFAQFKHRYLLASVLAAIAGLAWLVRRMSNENIDAATRVLFLMAIILVANPLRVVIVNLWGDVLASDVSKQPTGNQLIWRVTQPGSTPPDIYYVILDGYAGQATLQKNFEFDNHAFLSLLQQNGFYIASESRSNYPMTLSSIPSAMNMEYLHKMGARLGRPLKPTELKELIFNGRVATTLKAHGYQFLYVDSGPHLHPTNKEMVDLYLQYDRMSYYTATLLSFTILRDWIDNIGGLMTRYTVDGRAWVPDSIMWALQQIRQVSQRANPKFVFAHILSPHSPYYHDKSCNIVPAYQHQRWNDFDGEFEDYKAAYIGQLQCINREVEVLVQYLLTTGNRNAIIILQADHGPPEIMDRSILRHAPDTDLNLFRYNILNAYYVPEEIRSKLYPSISPVNTFRLIFNAIFQETNTLLPDQILEFRKFE